MQLNKNLGQRYRRGWVATQAFLRWYFPPPAKTFAMARQDEYRRPTTLPVASRAAKVSGCGIDRGGRSAGAGCKTEFWRDHCAWRPARRCPWAFRGFCGACCPRPRSRILPTMPCARRSKRISSLDDTHPGLRDRLEAPDAAGTLPEWSRGSARPCWGLKTKPDARFDRQWCADNATEWKLHHAWLQRVRARAEALQAGMAQASAADLAELPDCANTSDPRADVCLLYELALSAAPNTRASARSGRSRCLRGTAKPGWPACTVCGTWAATTAGGLPATALAEPETPEWL